MPNALKHPVAILLVQVCEFIEFWLIAFLLAYAFPSEYQYGAPNVANGMMKAVHAGLGASIFFNLITIYPIFSIILLVILIVRGARRALLLAVGASGLFLLLTLVWSLVLARGARGYHW